MSLDTAAKRASAIGEFSFWEMLPIPDAAIDQADRQQVAWVYGGVLAGELVSVELVALTGTLEIRPSLLAFTEFAMSVGGKVHSGPALSGFVEKSP